ncbi:mandelate racemase/muconate lactonizing enzyme family protein [Marinomonas mediterranea]|uniref:mandelate racemase/muconate lactonizing enzyme family protein n=1 Tax=Marinomonas mediterranea TaxID=119864 RepID=UPI00234BD1E3|nr:mandelate racemase/muconate lactonizing enzyme family protein [Marinomonas mediterranea]WCN07472.1 mandelate racemase/muconate lactonizing enzyme family protein [Marinomonas mediterranea]
MKITDIRLHPLTYLLEHAFESASMSFQSREHLLVEIICDNGLIGWGECLGNRVVNAAYLEVMTPHLIGKSAFDIEPIWLNLYNTFRDQGQRGAVINAISGIDIALWDVVGKFHNKPVSELLGGQFRSEIPVYATGGFRKVGFDRLSSLSEEVREYKKQGFDAVKIKIGFGVALDIESIKQTREQLGPDVELMIDANHGYDIIDAKRVIDAVKDLDIKWFEEPVVPEAYTQYRELRQTSPIPIAGGETWHSRWGYHEALKQNTVDIIQPDVCGVGGLSEARKILTLVDVYGVRCVPHVWGTAVAIAAGLHFHAIIPPNPPSFGTDSPRFEFDQTHNPFRTSIVEEDIVVKDGKLAVPSKPGLGITIDREKLARYAPISA